MSTLHYDELDKRLGEHKVRTTSNLEKQQAMVDKLSRRMEFVTTVRQETSLVDTEKDFTTPERLNHLMLALLDAPLREVLVERGMGDLCDKLEKAGISDYHGLLQLLPYIQQSLADKAKQLDHERAWKKGDRTINRRESHITLVARVRSIIDLYADENGEGGEGGEEQQMQSALRRGSSGGGADFRQQLLRKKMAKEEAKKKAEEEARKKEEEELQRQKEELEKKKAEAEGGGDADDDEELVLHWGDTDDEEDEPAKPTPKETAEQKKIQSEAEWLAQVEASRALHLKLEADEKEKRHVQAIVLKIGNKMRSATENVRGVLIPNLERKIRQLSRDVETARGNVKMMTEAIGKADDNLRYTRAERKLQNEVEARRGLTKLATLPARKAMFVLDDGGDGLKFSYLKVPYRLGAELHRAHEATLAKANAWLKLGNKYAEELEEARAKGVATPQMPRANTRAEQEERERLSKVVGEPLSDDECARAFNIALVSLFISHASSQKNFILPMETRGMADADVLGPFNDTTLLNVDASESTEPFALLVLKLALMVRRCVGQAVPSATLCKNMGIASRKEVVCSDWGETEMEQLLGAQNELPLGTLISNQGEVKLGEEVSVFAPKIPDVTATSGDYDFKFFFLGRGIGAKAAVSRVQEEEEKRDGAVTPTPPMGEGQADDNLVANKDQLLYMFVGFDGTKYTAPAIKMWMDQMNVLLEAVTHDICIPLETLISRFYHTAFKKSDGQDGKN